MTNPRVVITVLLLGLALGLHSGAQAQDSAPRATASITVDAAKIKGNVNPYVFSQGMTAADSAGIFGAVTQPFKLLSGDGFWNPESKQPVPAIADLSRQLNMGMMRYPSGSMVHNYNWKKTVGPLENRGEWEFGLDEYIAWCKALKNEPIITASEYVLPVDQMPVHNADMVEYLNAPATPDHPWAMKRKQWGHPDPYGVKYFELGNESSAGNENLVPRRQFTPEQYADYAVKTIQAVKSVDPTIKCGTVG